MFFNGYKRMVFLAEKTKKQLIIKLKNIALINKII